LIYCDIFYLRRGESKCFEVPPVKLARFGGQKLTGRLPRWPWNALFEHCRFVIRHGRESGAALITYA